MVDFHDMNTDISHRGDVKFILLLRRSCVVLYPYGQGE